MVNEGTYATGPSTASKENFPSEVIQQLGAEIDFLKFTIDLYRFHRKFLIGQEPAE